MQIAMAITPADLAQPVQRMFALAAEKVRMINNTWNPARGTPVFTVDGQYTARGWTEWTQGFQVGCALLAFDGAGDRDLLEIGRTGVRQRMTPHLTHTGVHDHGFNNLSTYGNLLRLMREKKIPADPADQVLCTLAVKVSGAVQAARWADAADGLGYIYSFNGPHSLFIDTMRTVRILGAAHLLGHSLMGENDRTISLLARSVTHGLTTARYSIYYGTGRDFYDRPELCGRTTHEAIFNRNDGRFRCPNSQQGYSPFTTWTRGLAWAMLGFAEELEFFDSLDAASFDRDGIPPKQEVLHEYEKAARAACDFYIAQASAADGICYWDTGAPGLVEWRARGTDYLAKPADPFNAYEPVDASAAAIAAQGLLRLGRYFSGKDESCRNDAHRYQQAALTVARTLLGDGYLALSTRHQGLLLHSVYHRPNGWDHIPPGQSVPCGESSMWGDYHLLELGLLVQRLADDGPYPTFFAI